VVGDGVFFAKAGGAGCCVIPAATMPG
jgi:hypothetical protein